VTVTVDVGGPDVEDKTADGADVVTVDNRWASELPSGGALGVRGVDADAM
jgi:hypothetical protein